LLGDGAEDGRVARVEPGHVVALLVRTDQFARDLVQGEPGGVHQPGAGRAFGEEFAGHQAARVEADPAGGQGAGAAQGDEVGGAGSGADEVHGHASAPGPAASGPVGPDVFSTAHWVTGIACRHPVKPPTGTACATDRRTSSPPRRRRASASSASDSRVTVLATSRPPSGSAFQQASRSPGAVRPPPMNTASGSPGTAPGRGVPGARRQSTATTLSGSPGFSRPGQSSAAVQPVVRSRGPPSCS